MVSWIRGVEDPEQSAHCVQALDDLSVPLTHPQQFNEDTTASATVVLLAQDDTQRQSRSTYLRSLLGGQTGKATRNINAHRPLSCGHSGRL